jgi:MtN3 and saliva related transmembrane protein
MQNRNYVLSIYMSWILSLGQSMHYVQAWKIFTTKSSEDISLMAYIICFILVTHWLIYGFIIKDKVIIIAETLGVIGVSLVIYGTLLYS